MTSDDGASIDAASLQAVIEEIDDSIAGLDSRVRVLEQSAPTTGADTQEGRGEAEYAPLAEWVVWFRHRFDVVEVTDAWESIPGVAEELAALQVAWQHTHSPDGTPDDEAIHWHEARIRCQDRISDLKSRHLRRTVTTG